MRYALLVSSLATGLMGLACYVALYFLAESETFLGQVVQVFCPITVAVLVYFTVQYVLRGAELTMLFNRHQERP